MGRAFRGHEEVIRVELEFWLGRDKELGEEFEVLSPLRSRTKAEVPEGGTLGELLRAMADRNPRLEELLFDPVSSALRENLLFIKNGRLQARSVLLQEPLSQGDEIRVIPVYAGG